MSANLFVLIPQVPKKVFLLFLLCILVCSFSYYGVPLVDKQNFEEVFLLGFHMVWKRLMKSSVRPTLSHNPLPTQGHFHISREIPKSSSVSSPEDRLGSISLESECIVYGVGSGETRGDGTGVGRQ